MVGSQCRLAHSAGMQLQHDIASIPVLVWVIFLKTLFFPHQHPRADFAWILIIIFWVFAAWSFNGRSGKYYPTTIFNLGSMAYNSPSPQYYQVLRHSCLTAVCINSASEHSRLWLASACRTSFLVVVCVPEGSLPSSVPFRNGSLECVPTLTTFPSPRHWSQAWLAESACLLSFCYSFDFWVQ